MRYDIIALLEGTDVYLDRVLSECSAAELQRLIDRIDACMANPLLENYLDQFLRLKFYALEHLDALFTVASRPSAG